MSGGLRRWLGGRPAPLPVDAPEALLEVAREGPVPLAPREAAESAGEVGPRAGAAAPRALHVAAVVPPFRRGSGGHSTIMHLLRGLETRGHSCSVWIEGDGEPRHFADWFGGPDGGVHAGFAAWHGADVALATGWQTVHRVLRLGGCGARAYLVQDHEPDFQGASAERLWAEETYRAGLPCVAASPWLAELLRERYGVERASAFELGVDQHLYHPRGDVTRREDMIAFYARASTPRRAVPLGLLALEELARRRPGTDIVLFGEPRPIAGVRFPHRHAGVLDGDALARLYSEATVGLVLSLTNPSLVPTEMLACGLPVVDVASESMRATFGDDGPIALAAAEPLALADAIERLLDDAGERDRRSAAGRRLATERTWERAAEQVDAALRAIAAC